mmetsp:Transcript_66721/g.150723  ORF Transcript_66721/g.150723 Transcript_66721/m.150723 type:complete len:278 (+) Transcript_66721:2336-3169(+)
MAAKGCRTRSTTFRPPAPEAKVPRVPWGKARVLVARTWGPTVPSAGSTPDSERSKSSDPVKTPVAYSKTSRVNAWPDPASALASMASPSSAPRLDGSPGSAPRPLGAEGRRPKSRIQLSSCSKLQLWLWSINLPPPWLPPPPLNLGLQSARWPPCSPPPEDSSRNAGRGRNPRVLKAAHCGGAPCEVAGSQQQARRRASACCHHLPISSLSRSLAATHLRSKEHRSTTGCTRHRSPLQDLSRGRTPSALSDADAEDVLKVLAASLEARVRRRVGGSK